MKRLAYLLTCTLLAPALAQAENACTAPGILIAEDAAGDAGNGLGGSEGTGGAFSDIERLSIAEPQGLQNRLVFTLKVASLAEPVPPMHRWVVYFTLPDGQERYAAMSTAESPVASFEYGTTSIQPAPGTTGVGQFNYVGDLDPASNYAADGTVTLVLDAGAVGASPGHALDFVFSKVRRSSPRPTLNMGLTLDDTGSGGFYVMAGNDNCAAGKSALAEIFGGALPPFAVLGLLLTALARRRR